MSRRLILALTAFFLLAPEAIAQEIVVQGIRIRLTRQDNAWIERSCDRRNLARDSEAWRQCVSRQ